MRHVVLPAGGPPGDAAAAQRLRVACRRTPRWSSSDRPRRGAAAGADRREPQLQLHAVRRGGGCSSSRSPCRWPGWPTGSRRAGRRREQPAAWREPCCESTACARRSATHVVLEGVDLEVERSQVVCLIGAVRVGQVDAAALHQPAGDRSTTARSGWTARTSPTRAVDADEVRRRIGIVFQAYNLFPHLTVLDNITLAPRRVHKVAARRGRERGAGAAGAVRAGRQGGGLPRPALRRAAAAGRDHPGAGDRARG